SAAALNICSTQQQPQQQHPQLPQHPQQQQQQQNQYQSYHSHSQPHTSRSQKSGPHPDPTYRRKPNPIRRFDGDVLSPVRLCVVMCEGVCVCVWSGGVFVCVLVRVCLCVCE